MSALSKTSRPSRVFKSNRSQAVRIPKDLAFPENVSDVIVRRSGTGLLILPKDTFWEDFFNRPACPDFPDHAPQGAYEERESFDR